LQVVDDPTEFSATNHPLVDVPIGTPIDDLDQLQGCWVSYAHVVYDDYYSGDIVESDEYAMLVFDSESKMYAGYSLYSSTGEPSWLEPPGSLLFITQTGPYEIIRDNAIYWETGTLLGGRLLEDGSIVPDYLAAVTWSLSDEDWGYDILVTVQGDYMTMLAQPDGYDPVSSLEDRDEEIVFEYWYRVDCDSVPEPG